VARKIRCVTFDCYGTLIDWEQGITRALLAIPKLAGRRELVKQLVANREEIEKTLLVSAPDLPSEDSPDERYESLDYRPYREILAESILLTCDVEGIELDPAEAQSAAATMSEWEPFADTREALEEIRSRFPVAILSNVEDEVIASAIRKLGIPFDLVITAQKVESYKPSPDHWYAAMHELEADEEELFHLAASPFHDLETATLLGIPCGYVNRSGHPLLPEADPLFTVKDMKSAAARLKGFTPAGGGRTGQRPDRRAVPSRPHSGPPRRAKRTDRGT
jgi:2-haloalkanoic acid dehalogenase type II